MDEMCDRDGNHLRLKSTFNVRSDQARVLFTGWVQEALAEEPEVLIVDFTRLTVLTSTIIAMTHLACGLAARQKARVEVVVHPNHRTGFGIIKRPTVLSVRYSA